MATYSKTCLNRTPLRPIYVVGIEFEDTKGVFCIYRFFKQIFPTLGLHLKLGLYRILFYSELSSQISLYLTDLCTPVYSTNKTDRQDKTEIVLKEALNTITMTLPVRVFGIARCLSSNRIFKYLS